MFRILVRPRLNVDFNEKRHVSCRTTPKKYRAFSDKFVRNCRVDRFSTF